MMIFYQFWAILIPIIVIIISIFNFDTPMTKFSYWGITTLLDELFCLIFYNYELKNNVTNMFKEFVNLLKDTSINEITYWEGPRYIFERVYLFKKDLIKEFPNKKQLFEDIYNTTSEQEFLKVLQKYQTEEDRKNIWVHENEDGYLYLV